jgi:tetratricopeptide (TPR) repeat protein
MSRRLLLGSLSLIAATLSTALAAGQAPPTAPKPYPVQKVDDNDQVPVIQLMDEVDPNQKRQVVVPAAHFEDTPDPNEELVREINRLHKEREDLAKERARLEGRQPDTDTPAALELAQMRQKLGVVLQHLATGAPLVVRPPNTMPESTLNPRQSNPASASEPQSPTGPTGPGVTANTIHGRPQGDAYLEAQALFRAAQYKEALAAYRALQPESLDGEERLLVQYLTACCLRKLGKLDDAATLYRQVADAREDDLLTECSLWHLSTIGWRRDVEKQLTEIRTARLPK